MTLRSLLYLYPRNGTVFRCRVLNGSVDDSSSVNSRLRLTEIISVYRIIGVGGGVLWKLYQVNIRGICIDV